MARGIWKGTLGFGLVSIGVELFGVEAPSGIGLSMLDSRDHAPIGYRKYNKQTGEEIESSDIVKGYEVSKGRYVILTDADLKAANPHSAGSIDVLGFVPAGDIDLAYFDKPYVVGPLKGSERAYALFVKALEDTERVGVAQIVIRTKQHVAALYPYQGAIMVHLLRYDAELRKPSDVGIEEESKARTAIRAQELTMAKQLVDSMAMDWNPAEFHDTYREDLLALIEQRAAGPDTDNAVVGSIGESEPTKVLDLVSALKGSLAARAQGKAASKGATKRVTRKSTSKASTASKAKTESTARSASSRSGSSRSTKKSGAKKTTSARKSA